MTRDEIEVNLEASVMKKVHSYPQTPASLGAEPPAWDHGVSGGHTA